MKYDYFGSQFLVNFYKIPFYISVLRTLYIPPFLQNLRNELKTWRTFLETTCCTFKVISGASPISLLGQHAVCAAASDDFIVALRHVPDNNFRSIRPFSHRIRCHCSFSRHRAVLRFFCWSCLYPFFHEYVPCAQWAS